MAHFPIKHLKTAILLALGSTPLLTSTELSAAISSSVLPTFTGTTVKIDSKVPFKAFTDYAAQNQGWTHKAKFLILQIGSAADISSGKTYDVKLTMTGQGTLGTGTDPTATQDVAYALDNPAFAIWTSGTTPLSPENTGTDHPQHGWNPLRGPNDSTNAVNSANTADTLVVNANWLDAGILEGRNGWIGYVNAGPSYTLINHKDPLNSENQTNSGLAVLDSVGHGGVNTSSPWLTNPSKSVSSYTSSYTRSGTSMTGSVADSASMTLYGLKSGYYMIGAGGSCPDPNPTSSCGVGNQFSFEVSAVSTASTSGSSGTSGTSGSSGTSGTSGSSGTSGTSGSSGTSGTSGTSATPDTSIPKLINAEFVGTGQTLANITVSNKGVVSKVTLSGIVANQGTLKNVSLAADTLIIGGTVAEKITGDPAKPALLNGVTIASGATLSNVSLFGSATNSDISVSGTITQQGTLKNVTLGANTTLTGGSLSGKITGDSSQPALLNGVSIESGTTLTNVVLNRNVSFKNPSEIIGKSVKYAQEMQIPDNLDLTPALKTLTNPNDSLQGPAIDLQQEVLVNPKKTLLQQIQNIPELLAASAQVRQTASGILEILIGNELQSLLTSKVLKTANAPVGISYTQDGQIKIVTGDHRMIFLNSVLQNNQNLVALLGSLKVAKSASQALVIGGSGAFYSTVCPALSAIPAELSNAPGLYSTPYLPDSLDHVAIQTLVFKDDDDQLRQQSLIPIPANWAQLRSALEAQGFSAVTLQPDGVIAVTDKNGIIYKALAGYEIIPGPAVSNMKFSTINDVNNDGQNDIQVTYLNGDKQTLILFRNSNQ